MIARSAMATASAASFPGAVALPAASRPALLPDRPAAYFGTWRDEDGEARLPLAVTLPAMVAVSLGLWAGIFKVAALLL